MSIDLLVCLACLCLGRTNDLAGANRPLTDDDWVSASPATIRFERGPKISSTVYIYPCPNGYFYLHHRGAAIGNLVSGFNAVKWDGRDWLPLAAGEEPGPQPNTFIVGAEHYEAQMVPSGDPEPPAWRLVRKGNPDTQLGGDFNSVIGKLIQFQGSLYAAGAFTSVGGTTVNRIARWDGNTWTALGNGLDDGGIIDMAILGEDLYVAGSFTAVAGMETKNIARWDGVSWTPLEIGPDSTINQLAVDGDDLYAVGIFLTVGDLQVNRIAKWDGESWSALGSGIDPGFYPEFDFSSPIEAKSVLIGADGHVYVSGLFWKAGDEEVHNLARWDGHSWSRVGGNGGGINGTIRILKTIGNELYASGEFSELNGVRARGIAKWDGAAWSSIGSDVPWTFDFVPAGSDLYVGGSFSTAGGVAATNIAKWDGTTWSALGSGLSVESGYATVDYLVRAGSNLYVSGTFTRAGSVAATNIARWDGQTWSALDSRFRVPAAVPLAASGQTVYAGYITDGIQGGIGKWDGSSWTVIGSASAGIKHLLVVDNTVYVAGHFTGIGGIAANNIARWNGTIWEPLGSGLGDPGAPHYVSALATHQGNLYAVIAFATGHFAEIPPPCQVYQWNGTSWTPIGSVTDRSIYTLATLGDELYVGGEFLIAGAKASGNLARVFLNGAPPFEKLGSRATAFFRGFPAGGYHVSRTTDFITWETLTTRYAGETGGIDFTDEAAPDARAFYRVVPLGP